MSIKEKLYNSVLELKNVYSLTALGMLLAIRVIVGIFANSTMAFFGNNVKIGLNFLPIAVAAVLYGPVGAALVGGLGDILSFFLNSAGLMYFPGYTLNGILTGIILGLFLYKNNVKAWNTIVSWLINAVFIEVLLVAYWRFFTEGGSYTFFLWTRVISESIKFVPTVLIILAFGKAVSRIRLRGLN